MPPKKRICRLRSTYIENSHPGYDEYRYDLDMIGHDPHELAAYLSAVLQGYTGRAPRRNWSVSLTRSIS